MRYHLGRMRLVHSAPTATPPNLHALIYSRPFVQFLFLQPQPLIPLPTGTDIARRLR